MVTCYLLRAHEPGMRRLFDVFVGCKSDKTEDEQDQILFRAVNAMLDKDGMKYLLVCIGVFVWFLAGGYLIRSLCVVVDDGARVRR